MTDSAPLQLLDDYDPDISWIDNPDQRRGFLGASDAAAILGLDQYRSPIDVWLEKTGRAEPFREGNDATERGHRFEPVVADWVADDHPEWDVIDPDGRSWRHPEHAEIVATPDRFLVPAQLFEDRPGVGLLEIKTATWRLEHRWEGDAPDNYIAQVLVQMLATGCRWGVLVCLVDLKKIEYEVRWDAEVAAHIRDKMLDFWRYVETDTPPPVTGHALDSQALAQVWEPDPEASVEVDPLLIGEAAEIRRATEDLAKQADRVKQRIQQAMGEATSASVDGQKVAIWTPKTAIDMARLEADHPEVVAECSTKFDAAAFRKAHPMLAKTYRKPNGRMFKLTDGALDVS